MNLHETWDRTARSILSSNSGTGTPRGERRTVGGALLGIALAGATLLASPVARAGTVMPAGPSVGVDPGLTLVAEGCGPGRWRGPWGGCHGAAPWAWHGPAYGPAWPPVYGGGGCPPGFWRGPWGHCRDTPYHGRLPDGGWR